MVGAQLIIFHYRQSAWETWELEYDWNGRRGEQCSWKRYGISQESKFNEVKYLSTSGIFCLSNCVSRVSRVVIYLGEFQFQMDREKHFELRNGYDNLEKLTAQGPDHKEFVEPKVEGLWRMAQQGKFSTDELTSLKVWKHSLCVCVCWKI